MIRNNEFNMLSFTLNVGIVHILADFSLTYKEIPVFNLSFIRNDVFIGAHRLVLPDSVSKNTRCRVKSEFQIY